MPWWDGLSPESIRKLRERYPTLSLEQVAIEAMKRPGYADEFARLDAQVVTYRGDEHWPSLDSPDDEPYVQLRTQNAAAFRDLVVAAMLADGGPAEMDDLLGGLPYKKADYEVAGKLHAAGRMTVKGIATRRNLSQKRAYRIYRQLDKRAVLYDEVGLRPSPGYRWDPVGLEKDPPDYTLIRA
jgi:hypothetical protein